MDTGCKEEDLLEMMVRNGKRALRKSVLALLQDDADIWKCIEMKIKYGLQIRILFVKLSLTWKVSVLNIYQCMELIKIERCN